MTEVEKIEQAEVAVETTEASVQAPKPKQYLLMADEVMMAVLSRISPGMRFLEVEGLNMQGNDEVMLVVTPVAKPVKALPEL